MNSAQMMLKVISVFLSCRFISIAFASLVFITSTFANESILSIIKRQYGYGSIPFGVEYRRSIDGTFPENTNPDTAILYSPNAICKLFSDGKGNYLYAINREYPSGIKDKPFARYIYFISHDDTIKYTPERELVEIFDNKFDRNRDPFIINYIMGFPSTSGLGSNFININEMLSSNENNISISKESDRVIISLRMHNGKTTDGKYNKYYIFTLILGKISGGLYPLKSDTRLLVMDENGKESLLPIMAEILYKEYMKIGNSGIYIPKKIFIRRYEILTENTKEFKQKLFEQETIEITEIISDIDEVKKSIKLTIPESTALFGRKDGDMYNFSEIIDSLKENIDIK